MNYKIINYTNKKIVSHNNNNNNNNKRFIDKKKSVKCNWRQTVIQNSGELRKEDVIEVKVERW